jgi:hypothetical protein
MRLKNTYDRALRGCLSKSCGSFVIMPGSLLASAAS